MTPKVTKQLTDTIREIQKALDQKISKGKSLPDGTERDWASGRYKKINGKWVYQGEPKSKGGA